MPISEAGLRGRFRAAKAGTMGAQSGRGSDGRLSSRPYRFQGKDYPRSPIAISRVHRSMTTRRNENGEPGPVRHESRCMGMRGGGIA